MADARPGRLAQPLSLAVCQGSGLGKAPGLSLSLLALGPRVGPGCADWVPVVSKAQAEAGLTPHGAGERTGEGHPKAASGEGGAKTKATYGVWACDDGPLKTEHSASPHPESGATEPDTPTDRAIHPGESAEVAAANGPQLAGVSREAV
jgi:hypothetical protein